MIRFLERILGIELIHKNMEELSQDDVKIMDRVKKVEKDMADLLRFLKVERKETWGKDKRFTPPQTIVIKSEFKKRK